MKFAPRQRKGTGLRAVRAVAAAGAAIAAGQALAAEPLAPLASPAFGPQGYVGARYGGLWGVGSHLIDEKTLAATLPLHWLTLEVEGRGAGIFLSGPASARAMGAGHLYVPSPGGAVGGFFGMEASAGGGVA